MWGDLSGRFFKVVGFWEWCVGEGGWLVELVVFIGWLVVGFLVWFIVYGGGGCWCV